MTDVRFQADKEMSHRVGAALVHLVEAAKPYLAAVAIVTILLSIWAGLCAT